MYAGLLLAQSRSRFGPAFAGPTWLAGAVGTCAGAAGLSLAPALLLPPWAAVLAGGGVFVAAVLLLGPVLGRVPARDGRWLQQVAPAPAAPVVRRLSRPKR